MRRACLEVLFGRALVLKWLIARAPPRQQRLCGCDMALVDMNQSMSSQTTHKQMPGGVAPACLSDVNRAESQVRRSIDQHKT